MDGQVRSSLIRGAVWFTPATGTLRIYALLIACAVDRAAETIGEFAVDPIRVVALIAQL